MEGVLKRTDELRRERWRYGFCLREYSWVWRSSVQYCMCDCIGSGDIWPISLTWFAYIPFSEVLSQCFLLLFKKTWYMSVISGVSYLNRAGHSPQALLCLVLSACLLACWLKHARSLPGWRHTMSSCWFMTSVTHRRSGCETLLPSASFLSFDNDPVKLDLSSWCWRLFAWLFIDCALPPILCLSAPVLRPSHRMSLALINSELLIRACYPVQFSHQLLESLTFRLLCEMLRQVLL